MRIKLFSYLTIDYKAGEAMLNAMAAEGWELKRLFLGIFAIFKRTDRTDLRYFVDFGDSLYYEAPAYLALCADAGWVSVGYTRSMNLYASAPGTQPIPLQTDSALEYERFRKLVLKRLRTSGIVYGVLGVALLLLILGGGSSFWPNLCYLTSCSYFFSLSLFCLPVILLCSGIYAVLLLSRVRQWWQLTEAGEPIPVPERRGARWRSALTLLGGIFTLVLEFAYVLDLAFNQSLTDHVAIAFILILIPVLALTIFFAKKYAPRRRLSPTYTTLMLCGMVFLLIFNFFAPDAHPFQPTPQLPTGSIVDPDINVTTRGSFWGRRDGWAESFSREYKGAMWVETHTLRFDWLADGLQEYLWVDGMKPVAGHDGIWQADQARSFIYPLPVMPTSSQRFTDWRYTLLLRGSSSILLIEYAPDMPLDELLAYLDNWQ